MTALVFRGASLPTRSALPVALTFVAAAVVGGASAHNASLARMGSAVDELIPASAGFVLAPNESPGPALRTLADAGTETLADHAWAAGRRFSWSQTADAVTRALAAVLGHESTQASDGRPALKHKGASRDAQ